MTVRRNIVVLIAFITAVFALAPVPARASASRAAVSVTAVAHEAQVSPVTSNCYVAFYTGFFYQGQEVDLWIHGHWWNLPVVHSYISHCGTWAVSAYGYYGLPIWTWDWLPPYGFGNLYGGEESAFIEN